MQALPFHVCAASVPKSSLLPHCVLWVDGSATSWESTGPFEVPLTASPQTEAKSGGNPEPLQFPIQSAACHNSQLLTDSLKESLAAEAAAFNEYLSSDDSRLPSDPELQVNASNPQDYTTYVGEDDWNKSKSSEPEDGEGTMGPVPQFSGHVQFVKSIVDHLATKVEPRARSLHDEDFGVVLRGASGVANDVAWALPTRSLRCAHVQDVFTLLRMSSKLLNDVEEQQQLAPHPPAYVVMQKHRTVFEGCEFRLFLGLRDDDFGELLGACQRRVDQVFDHLSGWSATENHDVFTAFSTFGKTGCADLLKRAALCAPSTHNMLAVDIVYESATLPILFMGAATVEAKEEEVPANDKPVVDVEVFRLFHDGISLWKHFRHYQQKRALQDDADDDKLQPVFVATSAEDLCGDAQPMAAHKGLPMELMDAEVLGANPALKDLMDKLNAQAQRGQ